MSLAITFLAPSLFGYLLPPSCGICNHCCNTWDYSLSAFLSPSGLVAFPGILVALPCPLKLISPISAGTALGPRLGSGCH